MSRMPPSSSKSANLRRAVLGEMAASGNVRLGSVAPTAVMLPTKIAGRTELSTLVVLNEDCHFAGLGWNWETLVGG